MCPSIFLTDDVKNYSHSVLSHVSSNITYYIKYHILATYISSLKFPLPFLLLMKMALCHTFITLNSEYRLINTDQSLCFWWKRSHGDSEWWKETFCWCLSCFPQYFHFWLEVFSASVKEAGISSYRVDGKHLSRRYYLTMQDFLLCWNRFQTPWNSLLFQCHLPGIFAIGTALASGKVLCGRFI